MPYHVHLKPKIGVMGGSFNPFHFAHLNSLLTVREIFGLKLILVIPSFQTPLKRGVKTSPFHRLEMLQRALNPYSFLELDDQEVSRKGVSYTYDTIKVLLKKRNAEELFLIMGVDQFHIFDRWKNFKEILKTANLIVTSRPGMPFPKKKSEFPSGVQPFIEKRLLTKVNLKISKKKIYFCELKDMDIASSYIRKRLKEKKEVNHLIPQTVDIYIKENKLYQGNSSRNFHIRELIDLTLEELKQRKAYDIKCFEFEKGTFPFSFGLIACGANTRQTKALAFYVKKSIKKKFHLDPINEEGYSESCWIVLDYNDLVIHIFYDYTRKFYKLDELWESVFPGSLLSWP